MQSLREYIEERSIPVPFVGCWMWLRSFGSHGYGNASSTVTGVTTAHRVSYVAFKGPIPDGMLVQHSCDNRWCVNPDHLSLGTDKTNSDDKHRKGRANLEGRKFGPHPTRRFSPGIVAAIRASEEPVTRLARRCGVDLGTIQKIRSGQHYRDVASDQAHAILPLLPDEIEALNRLMLEDYAANGNRWPDELADEFEARRLAEAG